MCWSNSCIFLVLTRVVCQLNIVMRSSRTSAMKKTDWLAIGTECQGCGRLFGTLFAYDQHWRSRVLRGTACCALSDGNRFNVTAPQCPNMSTAALERKTDQAHARWRTVKAYFAYFADHAYNAYCNNLKTGLTWLTPGLKTGLPLGVRPVLRLHILYYFNILNKFAYRIGGGSYW